MKPTIIDAISALHPTVNFSIDNDKIVAWDISEIKKNIPEPKQADIDAKLVELQEEYDANKYQRDREPEYPSMEDQLDYIYHNGIAKWKSDMVKPVKDAHPKP